MMQQFPGPQQQSQQQQQQQQQQPFFVQTSPSAHNPQEQVNIGAITSMKILSGH